MEEEKYRDDRPEEADGARAEGRTEQEEAELQALFLLNNMNGMLSDKLLQVYEYFGSFREAYEADADEYFTAGLFKKEGMRARFEEMKAAEDRLLRRYERLEEEGIRLVSMLDENYPKRLRSIDDRPPLLYVCGRLPEEDRPTAGIIGARKCSEYGRSTAQFFAGELARRGIQVVSGLAGGIDGAAAEGALRAARESYGVLGCGVNICYPAENRILYRKMKNGEGGLISEFPPEVTALGFHFVLRNRIISGLSDVLLVIEAGEKSGTATTVEYALNQGREIYALPGRISDPLGFGCNRLLKEGASVLTSPSDILEYFGMEEEGILKMGEQKSAGLKGKERLVYDSLSFEAQHLETIADSCKLGLRETLAILGDLEKRGCAYSPGGAYYKKSV